MEATSRRRVENICVFCGTSVGTNPQYIEAAQELGRVMAEKNMHLIYGGGNLGLMGTISKAVHDRGSSVLGIIPKPLAEANLIGPSNGEELIVPGMSERLVEMINRADAFIALPGGLGTLEEIFIVLSWANLNIHQKPIGLYNVDGFYDFLCVFLEDARRNGFVTKPLKELLFTARTAQDLFDQILAFEPQIDPILSKIKWSEDDRGKKRRINLDLNL